MTDEERIEKRARHMFDEVAKENAAVAKRLAFRLGLRYRTPTWATASEATKGLYRDRATKEVAAS